jgi:enoyl-CoA hydratase
MPGRIHVEREGALAWLVFDHPERRNAISAGMWQAIPDAVAALDADPAVRVVVLRGAGDVAFVSGADISEFEQARTGADAAADYDRTTARAFAALSGLSKPLLAMVHGFCIGGGMATALAADLRYAADDAVFAIPAARLGLGYHMAGLEALAAIVGPAAAKEMLFSARRYDAPEARALGLVNGVHPKAALEREVRALAAAMAENAPLTLRAAKLALRELARDPAARDVAAVRRAILGCFESDDYREGVRAFLEKRRPRFSGR